MSFQKISPHLDPSTLDPSPAPSAANTPGRSGSATSPTEGAHLDSLEARYGKSRVQTTGKILALFYIAYDRQPPQGLERKMRVGAWCDALCEIPEAQLLPLAQEELRHRQSPFLPTPADLLARHNGAEIEDDEGPHYTPRANPTAYQPWPPQTATAPQLEAPPPNLADYLPGGAIALDLKRRLHSPHQPNFNPKSPENHPLSDTALLQRLHCDCQMETFHPHGPHPDPQMRALVLQFARYLEQTAPIDTWTPELAQSHWQTWQSIALIARDLRTQQLR